MDKYIHGHGTPHLWKYEDTVRTRKKNISVYSSVIIIIILLLKISKKKALAIYGFNKSRSLPSIGKEVKRKSDDSGSWIVKYEHISLTIEAKQNSFTQENTKL